jgi:hypothetical protein
MHKLDRYGRVINEYGQEMCFGNYSLNWNIPDFKSNPCSEIELPKQKENKHKYILIRR